MELHQLRGFYEIFRERSFTRAAEKLSLTPPAISLQIKALEEELGEILFERQRGSVSRRLLEQDFRAAGVEWPDEMNLGSVDVMKRLVAVGLEVAVVPQMAVRQEVAAGDLAAVEVRGLKTRPVGLVGHSGRSRLPAAEAFVEMLRSEALGQS
jgi:DNA-binding transcriptional LysR family regulator